MNRDLSQDATAALTNEAANITGDRGCGSLAAHHMPGLPPSTANLTPPGFPNHSLRWLLERQKDRTNYEDAVANTAHRHVVASGFIESMARPGGNIIE
jgi:hypothetical protein